MGGVLECCEQIGATASRETVYSAHAQPHLKTATSWACKQSKPPQSEHRWIGTDFYPFTREICDRAFSFLWSRVDDMRRYGSGTCLCDNTSSCYLYKPQGRKHLPPTPNTGTLQPIRGLFWWTVFSTNLQISAPLRTLYAASSLHNSSAHSMTTPGSLWWPCWPSGKPPRGWRQVLSWKLRLRRKPRSPISSSPCRWCCCR